MLESDFPLSDLKYLIGGFLDLIYDHVFHENPGNLIPVDICHDRSSNILRVPAEIKAQTIQLRMPHHQANTASS